MIHQQKPIIDLVVPSLYNSMIKYNFNLQVISIKWILDNWMYAPFDSLTNCNDRLLYVLATIMYWLKIASFISLKFNKKDSLFFHFKYHPQIYATISVYYLSSLLFT